MAGTKIYTVGHSNHSMEHFVDLLSTHEIGTLVDVRTSPFSKYVPHFRKNDLTRAVSRVGLRYLFLGRELGGLLESQYRNAQGKPDYERRSRAPAFQAGLDSLIEVAESSPTVVMCAEENPNRCHRRLLITPRLQDRGVDVLHIRGDGRIEPEGETEEPQMNLF